MENPTYRPKLRHFTNPDGTWKSGFIYRILLDGIPRYVGFTTRTIEERFREHIMGVLDENNNKLLYKNIRDTEDWQNKIEVEEYDRFGPEGPGSKEYDCCWDTLCNDTDRIWNTILGTRKWLQKAKEEVLRAQVLGITCRKDYLKHLEREGITKASFNAPLEIDAEELSLSAAASNRRATAADVKAANKERAAKKKAERLAKKAKALERSRIQKERETWIRPIFPALRNK